MMNIKEITKSEKFPVILIATVILVALTFTLLINLSHRFNPNYYAGTIFKQKIPLKRFREVHSHLMIENQMEYGKALEKFLPILDLENKTWNQLILLQAAEEQGVSATDKEVIAKIAEYPSFKKGGKFDTAHYNMILRQVLQIQPLSFEETIRESIVLKKLYDKITKDVTVTDEELAEEYQLRNQKIAAQYCLFSPEKFKENIKPSEEEITNYYKKHKQELRVPASINIEYIRMDFPKDGGVQKEVETKYKAKAIVEEYAKNPNLTDLAKKYKFEAKETDLFGKNSLNFDTGLPLKELLEGFKLPAGKIQAPVKNDNGFTVYLIKEKRPAYLPSLKEAQDTVIEILVQKKAEKMALSQAKGYLEKFKKAPDQFAAIAETDDIKVEKIPLLPKQEYFYALNLPTEEEKKLLGLTDKNPISEIINTPKGPCILHVEKFEAINKETFKKEKIAFKKMLIDRKKAEVFGNFAQEQIKKADKQPNPSLDFLNTLPEKK